MKWATAGRAALLVAYLAAPPVSYAGAPAAMNNPEYWYVVAVDNRTAKNGRQLPGTLRFADGFTLNTHLYDVQLLSDREDAGAKGYVFLLASSCRGCGAPLGLFLYSRESKKLQPIAAAAPGDHYGVSSLHDPTVGLALRERVYFGECLPGRGEVVLVQTLGPEDFQPPLTWVYRSVPGDIQDEGALTDPKEPDGLQSRIQDGSCRMLPERAMKASADYIALVGAAREPPLPTWTSYQIIGPQDHPFPIVYLSTGTFRTFDPEELIQLAQGEYLALERLNRTWVARSDCRSEPQRADGNALSIEIAQRVDGMTTRCIIPRDLTCVYWSDVNGLGILPSLRPDGGPLSTLAGEVNCSIR